MGDLAHLLRHIGMDDARHELHEQHHTDDAEQVRDTVADRDGVLILCCDSLLRRRERRGGRQRARQKPGNDGGELLRVIARRTALQRAGNEQAERSRDAAGEDDDKAQQHIGLEVVLHVLEEVRTGDEADGRDKEHKPQVFHDLQRL